MENVRFARNYWNAGLMSDGKFLYVSGEDDPITGSTLKKLLALTLALAMGADFVISVDVGYHGGETKCDGIVSIMMQAFAVMEWHIIKERVNTSDINIVPALGHINMASIAQAEETIEIGRQAARAQIPGILQALQDRGAKLLDSQ